MTADPKQKALAKKLAHLCMHAGHAAQNRIDEVLKSLESFPPTRRKRLLRLFHDALARELARFEARVEHAGPLSEAATEAIKEQLKAHYGHAFTLNLHAREDLLAGFRVRVVDDVYDASAAGRIAQLSRGSVTATL